MTEQEEKDCVAMKEAVIRQKVKTFDMMASAAKMGKDDLKNTGYESYDEALKIMIRDGQRAVKKLVDDHVKKYPDQH